MECQFGFWCDALRSTLNLHPRPECHCCCGCDGLKSTLNWHPCTRWKLVIKELIAFYSSSRKFRGEKVFAISRNPMAISSAAVFGVRRAMVLTASQKTDNCQSCTREAGSSSETWEHTQCVRLPASTGCPSPAVTTPRTRLSGKCITVWSAVK